MKVWILGRYMGRSPKDGLIKWDLHGVFTDEKVAEAIALTRTDFFIGPVELDKQLPFDLVEWEGCRYPAEKCQLKQYMFQSIIQKTPKYNVLFVYKNMADNRDISSHTGLKLLKSDSLRKKGWSALQNHNKIAIEKWIEYLDASYNIG